MSLKKATDIFNAWAIAGKDDGMQKHHSAAVNVMLDTLVGPKTSKFSFIDAGCGNGWVVRQMENHPLCTRSIGIDGAEEMIGKAKLIDPLGSYIHSDLLTWAPEETFDLIHSMEVFYYFNNPKKVISHIVKNWLNERGEMIMGIDFYKENSKSHSWPNDLNTHMELLGISDWVEIFEESGLTQVTSFQTNAKNDFPGTLVVHGIKGKS